MVTLVDDPAVSEFDALLASHQAVVVDFYATWCAPCKTYSPRFAQAAREARRTWPSLSVAFVKVDIDRAPELKRRYGVQSVPTTLVLERRKGLLGEKVAATGRLSGAIKHNDLLALIQGLAARLA
ncbi:MAG TPA: thioredoxin family protein [Candidatus Thermoplasmatota archaeon]|jgi:thiol-disulfide isomerase/thioredoxin|nr:thioredoxin family protein [Candidatus Thermoplasmatota archaeon]